MAPLAKYITSMLENLILDSWIHVFKRSWACWGGRGERGPLGLIGQTDEQNRGASGSVRERERETVSKVRWKSGWRRPLHWPLASACMSMRVCSLPYMCTHTQEHIRKSHKAQCFEKIYDFCIRGCIHTSPWPHVSHGLGISGSPL